MFLLGSAFKCIYIFFSPLLLAALFTAICKAYSVNHFAFWHFFFLGMLLLPVSCTMSQPLSIDHQAFCLSDLDL